MTRNDNYFEFCYPLEENKKSSDQFKIRIGNGFARQITECPSDSLAVRMNTDNMLLSVFCVDPNLMKPKAQYYLIHSGIVV